MKHTAVHLIRAFDGPRHERLEQIWRVFAQTHPEIELTVHENRGPYRLDHPEMLNQIWYGAEKTRYLILSELDFLPHPHDFFKPLSQLSADFPAVAAEFVTRDPDTWQLRGSGRPGPWFMAFLHAACPRNLNFISPGADTANDIDKQIPTQLLPFTDGRPRHWGLNMEPGSHLFFSRHYNDSPHTRIAGMPLSDILGGVDRQIEDYEKLQDLLCPKPPG